MVFFKNWASWLKIVFAIWLFSTTAPLHAQPGVVIDAVAPNQGLANAGFLPNDLLIGWQDLRTSTKEWQSGTFDSIWDWHWFLTEIAPRGLLTLVARRGTQQFTARLDAETIRKDQIRPKFSPAISAIYKEGLTLVKADDASSGVSLWSSLQVPSDLKAWLAWRSSQIWRKQDRWEKEHAMLVLAHQKAVSSRARLWISNRKSARLWNRQLLDKADVAAATWFRLSSSQPQSLEFASCLNLLGNIAWTRGDLGLAEQHYRQALDIKKPNAPNSRLLADSYNNLGLVAMNREKLDQAEKYHQKALAIRQVKVPESTLEAASWLNLGIVSQLRGDKEQAEKCFLTAVEITQRKAPQSSFLADALSNLGMLAWENGQLEKAEHFHLRALELKKKQAPNSVTYSISLNNLSIIHLSRGDIEKAQPLLEEAKGIFEAKAPNSLWLADVCNNLGALAAKRADWGNARDHFLNVMNIYQSAAPDSLALALSLANIAGASLQLQDFQQATSNYAAALDIYERKSPRSMEHGTTLSNLAVLAKKQGFDQKADTLSTQAYNIITEHLDTNPAGNQFTIFEASFRTHISLLAERGKKAAAFDVLEQFRAFVLLQQLAEHDVLQKLLPNQLAELHQLDADYDRLQNQQWQAKDVSEKQHLSQQLLGLRVKASNLKKTMLASSPTLFEYDQPLTTASALQNLGPGVLVLSFIFSEERLILFTLSQEQGLNMFPLGIKKKELVEKLKLLNLAKTDDSASRLEKVQKTLSSQLYQDLLEPARLALNQAKQLVIIPDGPLWHLPFATLGEGSGADFQYLVEQKPLTTVASLTLYQKLKRRKKRSPIRIAAFGDPTFTNSNETHNNPPLSVATRPERTLLRPLPATKQEVRAIQALFPDTQTYLGARATEEQIKSLGSDITWLHVGSHAFFNPETRNTQAGVYLSTPPVFKEGKDNGVLQYREIYNLQLNLDLLVLSACQTALGSDAGGQGLLGLTRAFQFAGTRAIVASLWEVDDNATAELMKHFYRNLKQGKSVDEALRQAQISMITRVNKPRSWWKRLFSKETPDYSDPQFWAAFQLIGPP